MMGLFDFFKKKAEAEVAMKPGEAEVRAELARIYELAYQEFLEREKAFIEKLGLENGAIQQSLRGDLSVAVKPEYAEKLIGMCMNSGLDFSKLVDEEEQKAIAKYCK